MLVRQRAMRSRLLTSALALAVATGVVSLALPTSTVACSCMQVDQPMHEAAAAPDLSVFTGTAGANQPIGVPIQITRWFDGVVPPSGVAFLDPAGFIDPMGGSCGTTAPDLGTEWIFAAGRNQVGRYEVSLCTTHAPLDSDQGQALLAEAVDVFGPGAVVEVPSAEPSPVRAGDPGSFVSTAVPIVLVLLFTAGLVAGLFLILGARRDR